MFEKVYTDKAPEAIGPYSQAVTLGNLVFTSGQLALDPKTGLLAGTSTQLQTEQIFRNLSELLKAAGSDLAHVVRATCYLKDMANFSAFNEVYAQYLTHAPARICVAAKRLPMDALVEIEVIAEKIES